MSSYPILKCINITSRHYKMWLASKLKCVNITTSEYFFLTNTPVDGDITAKKLCEIIIVDPALGTRTINTLVDKGYLVKVRNLDDKREFRISLTPAGITVRSKIIGLIDEYNNGIKSCFTKEQYEQLYDMTNALLEYSIAMNKDGGVDHE
ncbi:MAG: MarR family winged helix-turn-helix transcriptional regulator [Erysipelotrichaceae bacterium]|nr:MarR family winged helix-turn-helix transcriptional regulator [Erysipelotrichaceae bacterium]MDD3810392.1 MarR family winged helix-turn-helix transcriptional regulator [Erysipelotrichaceae bacterium]